MFLDLVILINVPRDPGTQFLAHLVKSNLIFLRPKYISLNRSLLDYQGLCTILTYRLWLTNNSNNYHNTEVKDVC